MTQDTTREALAKLIAAVHTDLDSNFNSTHPVVYKALRDAEEALSSQPPAPNLQAAFENYCAKKYPLMEASDDADAFISALEAAFRFGASLTGTASTGSAHTEGAAG